MVGWSSLHTYLSSFLLSSRLSSTMMGWHASFLWPHQYSNIVQCSWGLCRFLCIPSYVSYSPPYTYPLTQVSLTIAPPLYLYVYPPPLAFSTTAPMSYPYPPPLTSSTVAPPLYQYPLASTHIHCTLLPKMLPILILILVVVLHVTLPSKYLKLLVQTTKRRIAWRHVSPTTSSQATQCTIMKAME